MTNTEQNLLDRAVTNPMHCVTVDWGVQAGRRFGRRDYNAARKLVARGLFGIVASTSTPLYKAGYGENGRVYSTTFKLAPR